MTCPKCSAKETRVIDSRITKDELAIRRRRECNECEHRFSTIEEILRDDLIIIKQDGRQEDFDRNKLLTGIRRACEKRPIDIEQINTLIAEVMREFESEPDNVIPSKALGGKVMGKLKEMDQIAYVRFASVYKDFRDISEFSQEVSRLKKKL